MSTIQSTQTPVSLPADAIDLPEYANPYTLLVPDERVKHDPIEALIELREGIASLPKTARMFTIDRVVDDPRGGLVHQLTRFTPAWPVPDHFPGSRSTRRAIQYVNPHHDDAWLYSDAHARCECGAVVHSVDTGNVNDRDLSAVTARFDHTDDCRDIWRWRSRRNLWERRRAIMLEGLRNFQRGVDLIARLGYRTDTLRDTPTKHDVDLTAERDAARERMGWTLAASLHVHSPATLADAIGRSRNGVKYIIDEAVDIDIDGREMMRIRRGED